MCVMVGEDPPFFAPYPTILTIMQTTSRHVLSFLLTPALLTVSMHAIAAEPEPVALVPRPAKIEWQKGHVDFGAITRVVFTDKAIKSEAEMLAMQLRPPQSPTQFPPLPVERMPELDGKLGDAIVLVLDPSLETALGKEGYKMDVLPTP